MGSAWRFAGASLLVVVLPLVTGATAIDGYEFDDPQAAARYHALIAEFRCPKCLNTNLAGSDAPIASDLRRTVRRLIVEGSSDQEIRDFLQARYGDFVLYDPPFKPGTWLLWLIPAGLLLIALAVLRRIGARKAAIVPTDEEQSRIARLTGETGPVDGRAS